MRFILVVAVAAGLLPLDASAAGLKAGQWEVTATVDMGKNATRMPQLTPEQMAQMKQMDMKKPSFSGPHTMKTCITPQDAASGRPPMHESEDDGCTQKNFRQDGNHMTGEIVCDGDMKGTGDLDITLQGDEAYTSNFHFKGIAHGQPVDMHNTATGHWLQADCR